MATRANDVQLLCDLVGPSIARVIDARDGWPGKIEVQVAGTPQLFSAHVGPVHSFSRKPYEYRFQNPGQNRPVMTLPGTQPLLLGIWNTDAPPVLVAAQPEIRLGDMTRFSVLFHERLFRTAQQFGWAEPYRNNRGDLHWSFFPQLLPTFIEFYQNQISLTPKEVQIAVVGAGLVDQPGDNSAARARAVTTRLIRDAKFAKAVVDAYNRRCCMCGLNLGLVSGAHIFPVSAPGSNDQPTNDLALCENHHRAFDNHRIWIHPQSRNTKLHPTILEHARTDKRSEIFVTTTFNQLTSPTNPTNLPNPKMFEERYGFFDGDYDWVK